MGYTAMGSATVRFVARLRPMASRQRRWLAAEGTAAPDATRCSWWCPWGGAASFRGRLRSANAAPGARGGARVLSLPLAVCVFVAVAPIDMRLPKQPPVGFFTRRLSRKHGDPEAHRGDLRLGKDRGRLSAHALPWSRPNPAGRLLRVRGLQSAANRQPRSRDVDGPRASSAWPTWAAGRREAGEAARRGAGDGI